MTIQQTKCESGFNGWKCRLQENYETLEEWISYSEIYGLAERLGYDDALCAWNENPIIEGSVIPSDFCKSN